MTSRLPEVPGRRTGFFVVEREGEPIGVVTLDRRDTDRPGHLSADVAAVELSYFFLPQAWGRGYAAEACAAVHVWLDGALPGEPVVLCTQTANEPSMGVAARPGFTEVARFEEWGAEQRFGVRCSSEAQRRSTPWTRYRAEVPPDPLRRPPACTSVA